MIWILFVGLVAGIIARLISPGPNNPSGFILTIILGIAGAFLATFIGQMVGWYRPDQGAGFIAGTFGALAVLFIWRRLVASGTIGDPGNSPKV
ncbi:MAG: GlsB/YeaQ/YmgE family stress response membrane protein [Pseudolabrys sp.]